MKYIIVFPRGDKTRLCVAYTQTYEYCDYDRASRKEFDDEEEAVAYGKQLAREHGLVYEGSDGFLD